MASTVATFEDLEPVSKPTEFDDLEPVSATPHYTGNELGRPPAAKASIPSELETPERAEARRRAAGTVTSINTRTGKKYYGDGSLAGTPFSTLDAPVEGVKQIISGVEQAAEPGVRAKAGGAATAIGGALKVTEPLMVGTGLAAPIESAIALGTASLTQAGVEALMKKLDAPEEYTALASVLSGLVGASAGVHLTGLPGMLRNAAFRAKVKSILQDRLNAEYRAREAAERAAREQSNKPKQITDKGEVAPVSPSDIQEAEFEDLTPPAPAAAKPPVQPIPSEQTPAAVQPGPEIPPANPATQGVADQEPAAAPPPTTELPAVTPGAIFETPAGKRTVKSIDKGMVVYTEQTPDGSVIGKKLPLATFQRMVAPPEAVPEEANSANWEVAEEQPISSAAAPAPPTVAPASTEAKEVIQPKPTEAVPEEAGAPEQLPEHLEQGIARMKLPEYIKDTLREDVSKANKLGIIDKIEQLSAERKTAGEVLQDLGLDQSGEKGADVRRMVRSVRSVLGVPSMDDYAEFEKWIASRKTPAPEVNHEEPPTPQPVSVDSGGSEVQPLPKEVGSGVPGAVQKSGVPSVPSANSHPVTEAPKEAVAPVSTNGQITRADLDKVSFDQLPEHNETEGVAKNRGTKYREDLFEAEENGVEKKFRVKVGTDGSRKVTDLGKTQNQYKREAQAEYDALKPETRAAVDAIATNLKVGEKVGALAIGNRVAIGKAVEGGSSNGLAVVLGNLGVRDRIKELFPGATTVDQVLKGLRKMATEAAPETAPAPAPEKYSSPEGKQYSSQKPTLPKDLKVGDRIFTIEHGYIEVKKVLPVDPKYPKTQAVETSRGVLHYDSERRLTVEHLEHPTAEHPTPSVPATSPKDAFKMKAPELQELAAKGDEGAKAELDRRAAKKGIVQTPPEVKAAEDTSNHIMTAYHDLVKPHAPGNTVTFQRLRAALPDIPKATFDEAIGKLQKQGKISLSVHDHAERLPESEREPLVKLHSKDFEPGHGMVDKERYYASMYSTEEKNPTKPHSDKDIGAFLKGAAVAEKPEAKAEAANTPKKKTPTQISESVRQWRREVFTPGNIVLSDYWKTYDKVLDYTEKPDHSWTVTVQKVNKDGSPIPGELPRIHYTQPSRNDQVVGRVPIDTEKPIAERAKDLEGEAQGLRDRQRQQTKAVDTLAVGDELTPEKVNPVSMMDTKPPANKAEDLKSQFAGAVQTDHLTKDELDQVAAIFNKPNAENEPTKIEAGVPDATQQPVRGDDHKPLEAQLPEQDQETGTGGAVAGGGGKSGRVRQPRAGAGEGEGSKLEPSGGTVSGVVGNPAHPEQTFPPRAQDVVSTHHDRDYRIPDGRVVSGSPEARARINIYAIKLLREIQADNRVATVEEQKILAGYVGWGAVPQLFAGNTPEWRAIQEELKSLISAEEYSDASRSTTNAHYTGDNVVDAMWKLMVDMGAKPGMSWLEPAVGTGNYFGRQPQPLLAGARRMGIDKDALTGQIAKLLYPDSGIDVAAYEEAELPENYFDGIISNVPFGNFGVSDARFKGKPWLTHPIHNYFFAKSLDHVRPGGIIGFVTSRHTMDNFAPEYVKFRNWISERADLLGAIRLPSGAFRQNAGTDVITDIIYLRKRLPGAEKVGDTWAVTKDKYLRSELGSRNHPVNEYYHAHPEMILGTEGLHRGEFSSTDYNVKGSVTQEQMEAALAKIAEVGGFQEYKADKPSRKVALKEINTSETAKLGGLFFDDKGNLFRKTSKGAAVPVDISDAAKAKVKGQLGIRNALVTLLDAELTDKPEAQIEGLRKTLNQAYDAYVKKNGPLSSQANVAAMKGDPDAPRLINLERKFKKGNKSKGIEAYAEKAPIFSRRQRTPAKSPDSVSDPKDALGISLNETGRIAWDRMSQLTGTPEETLKKELTGLVFQDPTTNIWQMADEYLSGSVRKKLKEAKAIAKMDPRYQANVDALEKVQPEDLPPGRIKAVMGVTWVPLDTYAKFIEETLGASQPPSVTYMGGNWKINAGWGNRFTNAQKWRTAKVDPIQILEDTMNLQRTVVKYKDDKGGVHTDAQETAAAQAKQAEIQEAFDNWIFAEPERATQLLRIYNDTQNDLQQRKYDGSHLTLPGMTRDAAVVRGGDLDPRQKAGVWRQIVQPNMLLAHAPGFGKTFEMIAGGMELKRLGLISRPMYVVPNSTLTGWQQQFAALYPAARVLVFSETDLEKSKRQRVMAEIAAGNWDAVVVPHSSFGKIPTGDEIFNQHYEELADQLQESIMEAQDGGVDTRQIKRMEKAKERLLTSLKDKRNEAAKDQTVSWEQLGIDQLFIDESHYFRKLGFSTKQINVAGIDTGSNQMTFDLLMKMRHVQTHGRGVVFATGTPVVNTMGELYSLMRYLIEPELKARGLGRFDEWAAQFGKVVPYFEPKIGQKGYRLKNRFAKFQNLQALSQLFRSFADVVTSDMLDVPRPDLYGGKRKAIATEMSEEQEAYRDEELSRRAKAIEADPRNALPDNMLAIFGDAQKMAIDLRMVKANAVDDPGSRLNTLADRVHKYWEESKGDKGTQLVFLDLGKPEKESRTGRFSAYDEIVKKLVDSGIPRDEIATIYDAKNKTQRTELFQKVNDGTVRVLLASSKKGGVGVNVQERVYAIHHVDIPHVPSDLEQREARGIRQGNRNPNVRVDYYLTKGTLDENKFSSVARKGEFINDFLKGESGLDEAEDVSGMVPSLQMFQAMSSQDPRVMQKMAVDMEVDRLGNVLSGWRNQQYKIKSELASIPSRIAATTTSMGAVKRDIETVTKAGDKWEVGKKKLQGDKISKDVNEAMRSQIAKVMQARKPGEPVEIGSAFGLPVEVTYYKYLVQGNDDVGFARISLGDVGSFDLSADDFPHADIYRRVVNQVDGLSEKLDGKRALITKLERDRKDLEASIEDKWPYSEKLNELLKEQKELADALGAEKGDAAAAGGEAGEEIGGTANQDVDDDEDESPEEEGERDDEEEEEEGEVKAKAPAKLAPKGPPPIYEGGDRAKLAASLRPISALKTPQVRSVWGENLVEPGPYITDGHALFSGDITPTLKETLTKGSSRYTQAKIKEYFEKYASEATKPLTEMGYGRIKSKDRAGKPTVLDVMYYKDRTGQVYAIDADYLSVINRATGNPTEVMGASKDKPLVFNKDGKPVAVMMPMSLEESDTPAVSSNGHESERGSLKIQNPRAAAKAALEASGDLEAQHKQLVGATREALNTLSKAMGEEAPEGFGEKVRTFVTGERDARIAETNHLRDEIKAFLPDTLDQEALSLMRDFKKKPEELEDFLKGAHEAYNELQGDDWVEAHERIQDLEKVIQRAMHPTPEMLGADDLLTNYFEKHLAEGKKLGFLNSDIGNDEYITHLLKPRDEAEKPTRFGQLFRGKLGPRKFKFAKHRAYPTILHAIVGGAGVRSLNALDALGVYGEKYATTAAYHLLLKAIRKTKAGKWGTYSQQKKGGIPANWVELSPESRIFRNEVPFLDEEGNASVAHQTLFVPPKLEEALRPILDPNYMNRVPGFQKSRAYQAWIKTIELGLSVFHLKSENLAAMGSMGPDGIAKAYMAEMDSPEFRNAEKSWVRAGLITPVLDKTVEVYKALQPSSLPTTTDKIRSLPGIKQLDKIASNVSYLTFGLVQRKFKVMDASIKYAAWLAKHPDAGAQESFEAQRQIAKQINAVYGGLNWENMGVNRTALDLSKALFLAPDWFYSNWLNAKYAFEHGVHGPAARLFWLKSIMWGLALTAGTSLLMSGHVSKDPTRVALGRDKNGKELDDNVYFVGAPGDLSSLIHNSKRYGAVIGLARTIGSKLAPFPRAAVHLVSKQDATGREIIPKSTNKNLLGQAVPKHQPGALEKTGIGAEDLAKEILPVPLSVTAIAQMLMDSKHHYTKAQYAEAALSGRKPQEVR